MLTATQIDKAKSANGLRAGGFRCYIRFQKSTGLYVAECIDLDIMVKARKENKAKRQLEEAILGYVQAVIESGEFSLLRRPSP